MTAIPFTPRDYSLTGPEARHAIDAGLASAEWYHSDVPRKVMKDLMARRDGPAIRDTVIWLALLILSATGGILTWGTWWAVAFFAVYGVLYGSACDSRWHECGHGTAFRTKWMNTWVYTLASFMVMRNPVSWRWSHARHHTDTIIVGRDPEIGHFRPPQLRLAALHFIGIPDIWLHFRILLRNALGIITPDEADYIPASERPKAILWARIFVSVHLAAVAWALATSSLLPVMLIGGPRVYGTWHMVMTGLLQHGGLAEDVLDHRLNSRTVLMNPVSRWLYWNMNYHVEHHMFPMVPYHALPRLHATIKHDLPPPNPSILQAYAEMTRALWRQRSDPTHTIIPALPPTARPYRADLHQLSPERGAP
ncbi:MAG: fatty acid desaturase family protein [Tabrizicola sp.]|uniref:fatty acid desaturase family protein n=1 Tax=Tabrizicola sp. TaxID=2005166 RepID=UPI0027335D6E|nr:fatty acid desaturase family protein [Tabrizicola sp.]MDP3262897.1 fatty acid desaturase family protein [Tabrizicola sp.]MDP3649094.1 fatty acid desaturase family protein [Paracoccaceae bacterium]MDZ4065679.1 fatty acid desaturase family protein [Tabrizicola sp.]